MILSSITKEFSCNKEKLWDIITDNTNYLWRSDLSKIKIVDDNHFIEYAKNGFPTYFEIIKKERFKEYSFNLNNGNMKGRWTGFLRELPNGHIELTFTEEIETDNSVMKLFAKPYLKKQQKRYMRDLEMKLTAEASENKVQL